MIRDDTTEVLMAIVSFSGEAGLGAALARAGVLLERYARGRNVAIG
jgi:hypothetical protein